MDTNQNLPLPDNDDNHPSQESNDLNHPVENQESEAGETEASEIIPIPVLEITHPTNKDTMEVHHHGHVHEQKKWKEYLFQFFMLFLAVFCGFLAEYQLEQIIERHREGEYIASFINDLKSDTAQMRLRSADITKTSKGIDSLLLVSKDLSTIENVRLFCYFYIQYVPHPNIVFSNEGTMQQLKNAGGLRLIKNKKAVDSILNYDSYNKRVMGQGDRYRDNVVKALDATDFIFDWNVFDGRDPNTLLKLQTSPLLQSTKEQMQYFINRLIKQKGVSIIYQLYLEDQFQRAARLLPLLQKEYRL